VVSKAQTPNYLQLRNLGASGNHEFYGQRFDAHVDKCKEKITVLEKNTGLEGFVGEGHHAAQVYICESDSVVCFGLYAELHAM
jgi:hypothetical protein